MPCPRPQARHGGQGGGDDTLPDPFTTGVDGSDDACDRIGEEHRDAVGHQHAQHQARRRGHQRVGGGYRTVLGSVDDGDAGTVHLVHPDEALLRHTELARHPLAVGRDVGGVVPDVVPEVEGHIGRTGPAAPPVGDDPAGPYRRLGGRWGTHRARPYGPAR
jgi:hypothetical protein